MFLAIGDFLNNREIAFGIWGVILLVIGCYRSKDLRRSIVRLCLAIIQGWQFFSVLIVYVLMCLFFFYKLVGCWSAGLTKVVIFWFFGWALVVFINSDEIVQEKKRFKKTILEIIGVSVLVSFISNFYSFPLLVELVLVPVIGGLAAISAFVLYRKEYEPVGKISNVILGSIGISVLVSNTIKIFSEFEKFATSSTLLEFLIPVLLSFLIIPFLYAFNFYCRWEQRRVMDRLLKRNEEKKQYDKTL